MYYSINPENGLLYSINSKYLGIFNENHLDELIEDVEGVSFLQVLRTLKEKIILFLNNSNLIKGIINTFAMLPTLPEVISYTIIKIL